jgi:UDP-glucose:(heptosyl)LPS alpha-1,3-glucosyltransferase
MRIAFMHRSLAGGGTEADLRRMASGLASRRHVVHVFTAGGGTPPAGVIRHRVPVVRAGRLARLVSFAFAAPQLVARQPWDVVVGFGRTTRQDVVRVGGGTHRSYLAAMQAAGERGAWRGPYHGAILWLERRMFAPGGHRRVLAVSRRVATEVERDYGVPPAHVRVIYNGVDLERFHPRRRSVDGPRVRAALGLGDRPLCLAVGTGFARKGFDRLLACWRAGPPAGAALVVVGADERLAAFRRRAEAAPLAGHVHVLGPRDDVDALLAAADVLCLPSRQEAFGNVVLEAAAAGVPVVASTAVGAAELLEGALAELVVEDADDPAALGAAIARALRDGWPERSGAARRLAERHPWSRHLDELEAFLQETADAR